MNKITLSFIITALFSILLFSGCKEAETKDTTKETLENISKEIKSKFAPDGRSTTYEVNINTIGEQYVLKGVTTKSHIKDSLLKRISGSKISVIDSIEVLPSASLGDKLFGITTLSVANLRTSPSYSSESATQILLGTPVKVLEKRSYWLRVITPEGYIAWVTEGSISRITENEYQSWKKAKKYIVNTHYTLLRETPSDKGTIVCDAVWGGILESKGVRTKGFTEVTLPSGKTAYAQTAHLTEFNSWLATRKPNAENIINTGKQFLGFPYMWGGTSVKAMDCSGFTKNVFYLNGVVLLRDASQQGYTGEAVELTADFSNLKPGDLLFFGNKATETRKERFTHVGIYLGDKAFIHAATSVRINSLDPNAPDYYESSNRLISARRMIGNEDSGKDVVSIINHPYYF